MVLFHLLKWSNHSTFRYLGQFIPLLGLRWSAMSGYFYETNYYDSVYPCSVISANTCMPMCNICSTFSTVLKYILKLIILHFLYTCIFSKPCYAKFLYTMMLILLLMYKSSTLAQEYMCYKIPTPPHIHYRSQNCRI